MQETLKGGAGGRVPPQIVFVTGSSEPVLYSRTARGIGPGYGFPVAHHQTGSAFDTTDVVIIDPSLHAGREAFGGTETDARMIPAIRTLFAVHDDMGRIGNGIMECREALGDRHGEHVTGGG